MLLNFKLISKLLSTNQIVWPKPVRPVHSTSVHSVQMFRGIFSEVSNRFCLCTSLASYACIDLPCKLMASSACKHFNVQIINVVILNSIKPCETHTVWVYACARANLIKTTKLPGGCIVHHQLDSFIILHRIWLRFIFSSLINATPPAANDNAFNKTWKLNGFHNFFCITSKYFNMNPTIPNTQKIQTAAACLRCQIWNSLKFY